MNAFDRAVAELYQAPHATFVAERKRLAGELKKDGHREEAARLAKLPRPPISVWVVNQLWWHARDAFDTLLATATKLRKGQLAAAGEHRDAIAKLRQRAAAMLEQAGNAATEATLRRVTQTLAAIAVAGGFDPDPPGALAADRDPPGFEAIGIVGESRAEASDLRPQASGGKHHDGKGKHDGKGRHDDAARRAAEEAEERNRKRREEEERARIKAERHRLEAALRTAKGELHTREREVVSLEKRLAKAREDVESAKTVVSDLQSKLDDGN